VITGIDSGDVTAAVSCIAPGASVFSARHVPTVLNPICRGTQIGLGEIQGRKVFALSSIAHPESFARTLDETGALSVGGQGYPDHHLYTQEDVSSVENKAKECGAEFVVTTEKDAAKLEGIRTDLPFLALETRFSITDEERFWSLIDRVIP
jgi:tetraacyldisaccharide 4'-kinase